jgi:hypothetical protein
MKNLFIEQISQKLKVLEIISFWGDDVFDLTYENYKKH